MVEQSILFDLIGVARECDVQLDSSKSSLIAMHTLQGVIVWVPACSPRQKALPDRARLARGIRNGLSKGYISKDTTALPKK